MRIKLPIQILLLFAGGILLQSCGAYRTLFPKKQNQYINYRTMFDIEDQPNTKPQQLIDEANNGKIRIISINKITNDTVVEWVDPVVLGNGKKLILPVKTKNAPIEVEMRQLTREFEILAPHKAVVFKYDDGGTNFQERNDTLFVTTSQSKVDNILLELLGKNTSPETTPVVDNNIIRIIDSSTIQKNDAALNPAEKIKKLLGKRILNKEKRLSKKLEKTKDKLEAVQLKKDSVIELVTQPTIPIAVENSFVVGDIQMDTDPNATTITDKIELQSILSNSKIAWQNFKCKAKVRLKTESDNKAFNANVRMLKNNITWASIHIPIVGEIFRAKASPDTIAMLDKWKDKFYNYPTQDMGKILGLPIAYNYLQNYIIGNVPELENIQTMLGKKSANGTVIKCIQNGLTTIVSFSPEGRIKYILAIGNNNGKSYSVKNTFTDYELIGNQYFSNSRNIQVLENGKQSNLSLELSKPEIDGAEPLEFPYTIPGHFKNGNSNNQ
jgi:hypothetical protein